MTGRTDGLGDREFKLFLAAIKKQLLFLKKFNNNSTIEIWKGKMNNHPTKKRRKETNGNMNAIRSSKRRSTANSNDGEYCELPFTLSSILIDEFDCITAGGGGRQTTNASTMLKRSVHVLPSKITVRQVLEHYRRKRSNISSHGGENQIERDRFCDGLALLFDEALPVCLLYREERTQYENLQNDESLRLKRPW